MSDLRRLWPLPWLMAGLAIAWIGYRVPARLEELRQPPPESGQRTSTALLFDQLAKERQIAFVSSDSARLTEPASGEDGLGRNATATKAGEAIRDAIRQWNQQRRLAAIRDDRAAPRDGRPAAGPFLITAKTLQPAWKTSFALKDTASGLDFPLLTGGQVLTDLGVVAWPLRPSMSDWLAAPVPTSSGIVTFKSELPPGLGRLGVDVVGRVQDVWFGDPGAGPAANLGSPSVYARCSRTISRKLPPVCPSEETARDLAHLELRPPAGARQVLIRVEPVELPIAELPYQPDDSRIGLYPPGPEKTGMPCGEDQKGHPRLCVLRWDAETRTPRAAAWRSKGSFTVRAADGTLLLQGQAPQPDADLKVEPTADASALGLLPLLGLGPSDWGGLASWLAWRQEGDEPLDIVLSIRPDWQETARKVLEAQADIRASEGDRGDQYKDGRRAAVVLLNAATGAILAAASTPRPQLSLNEWDLHAIEGWNPNASPLAAWPWRNADADSAPGSVWKLISAIALIDIASGAYPDEDGFARKAILGYALKDLAPDFGASPEAGSLAKPYEVRTPGGQVLGPIYNARQKEGLNSAVFTEAQSRCPNETGHAAKIGLCEALIESINVWFVHALLKTDGRRIVEGQNKVTGLAIQAAARRLLGPDLYLKEPPGTQDLLAPLACLGRPEPCPADARRKSGRGSRGLAERSGMTVSDDRPVTGVPLFKLAENSFGQGVQTTPLQVAALYAALSAHRAVQPYLIERMRQNGQPVPFERPPIEPERTLFASAKGETYWPYLERGLAGVSGPAGAANPGTANAMRAFNTSMWPTRLLSKTGTAEIESAERDENGKSGKQEYKTAWYAGLLHDVTARVGASEQTFDIAFACMVTHSRHFGGEVCAPIMRDILQAIDRRR